jgi:hypothetical protein
VPGVGSYNLLPTDDQIKKQKNILKQKKIKISEKSTPFMNTAYLSSLYPGPGAHNPQVRFFI